VKVVIPIAVLFASAAMSAQDGASELDLRIQIGAEMTRPYQSVLVQDIKVQPDYQTGLQLRMLGEIPGAPGFYYQFGGKLESSSNYKYYDNGIDMRDVEVAYSHISFGASYLWNWKSGFSLGAHLEGRAERIVVSGPVYDDNQTAPVGNFDGKVSYFRPWGRLSMDYTFNTSSKYRPFMGIEGAYPITRREQKVSWNLLDELDSNLMEAIAPRGSIGCYIGLRF